MRRTSIMQFGLTAVTICATTALPTFSQGTGKRTVDPHAMEKAQTKQSVINASREMAPIVARNQAAAGWTDISAAPQFPAPIFKGTETKFMRMNMTLGMNAEAAMNSYGRQLIMRTKDPVQTVYQWYQKSLPLQGFKLDDKIPHQTKNGKVWIIKGDSNDLIAMVTFIPKDEPTGPVSQICMSVIKKPPPEPPKDKK